MSNGKYASPKIEFPNKKCNIFGNKLLPLGKKSRIISKKRLFHGVQEEKSLTRTTMVMKDM